MRHHGTNIIAVQALAGAHGDKRRATQADQSRVSTNPDTLFPIFQDALYAVMNDTIINIQVFQPLWTEAEYAVVNGAEPDISTLILHHGGDHFVGKFRVQRLKIFTDALPDAGFGTHQ